MMRVIMMVKIRWRMIRERVILAHQIGVSVVFTHVR